ncbi:MAG: hypothetical protein IKD43_01020 [Clostridia bacterium]|nr:hypothetical protein [Clostridia bacterium]
MEEKGFTKKQIIAIVLGVLLTTISFCLYFLFNKTCLNILCGIVCFLHMIYLMYFQLGNKEEFTKKQRIIFPTILISVFYGCLITLIILLNPLGAFHLDYILWVFFCGSSVIPIFYLLLVIFAFAS